MAGIIKKLPLVGVNELPQIPILMTKPPHLMKPPQVVQQEIQADLANSKWFICDDSTPTREIWNRLKNNNKKFIINGTFLGMRNISLNMMQRMDGINEKKHVADEKQDEKQETKVEENNGEQKNISIKSTKEITKGMTKEMKKLFTDKLNRLYFIVENDFENKMVNRSTMVNCDWIRKMFTLQSLMQRTNRFYNLENNNLFLIPQYHFATEINGAEKFYRDGIFIKALNYNIYPEYTVYLPTRSDYIDLFDNLMLSLIQSKRVNRSTARALDIGCGSGILSFLLLKHGFRNIEGIDINEWSIENANRQFERVTELKDFKDNLTFKVEDIFKEDHSNNQKYDLIVCNPPWTSSSSVESTLDFSIYDTTSHQFKERVMKYAAKHLSKDGLLVMLLSTMATRIEIKVNHFGQRHGLSVVTKKEIEASTKQSNYKIVAMVFGHSKKDVVAV